MSRIYRSFGYILLITLVSASLVLNFGLSYIRSSGISSISTDLIRFWEGHFIPNDFESLVLLFVGLLICAWSAYKFFSLHDTIPDLESADRALNEVWREISESKTSVRSDIGKIANTVVTRFALATKKLKSEISTYRGLFRESVNSSKSFNDGRLRIIEAHVQCILKRRTSLRNSTGQTLSFWNDNFTDLEDYMSDDFDLGDEKQRLNTIESQIKMALENLELERSNVENALRLSRESIAKTENKDIYAAESKSTAAQIIKLHERKNS